MQVTFDVPTRIGAILTLRSIQQASITELRIRKEGLKTIDFSKEELTKFGVQVFPGNGYDWDHDKEDETVTLEISEGVKNLICAQLDVFAKRNDKGKVNFPFGLLAIADYFGIEDPAVEEKTDVKPAA